MFFYEATSWEYSLSIPHDVPGLISKSGGKEAFDKRLDTFFEKNYYNVNNEPSFLTPCLYHWIGRPDKSSDRIHTIIKNHFNDSPGGLPGNDDSGAMSSWLAFHMMGLYPNAGQDYYLINTPILKETTFLLQNGKTFSIKAPKLSEKNRYIRSIQLNGKDYPYSTLRHKDILAGGELILEMGSKPGHWGKELGL
jgi:putative alpha-1,2-mannosidase